MALQSHGLIFISVSLAPIEKVINLPGEKLSESSLDWHQVKHRGDVSG